jgi:3-isopropylmalate/(R)-2-methylmalate dehydratase large subunit
MICAIEVTIVDRQMTHSKTLFEKLWSTHIVKSLSERHAIVHIDRHVLQETTCRQAFDGLRHMHLPVHDLELTYAMIDRNVSSIPSRTADMFAPTRRRIVAMRENCREMGVELFDINDPRQGIVHIIAPEFGIQTDLMIPAQVAFVYARVYDHTGSGGCSQ